MPALPENVRVESRPYDHTQEMRAMILAALPLPPLPVVMERLDEDNRVDAQTVQTSHDVFSNLLLHACARNSESENTQRRAGQTRILRSLVDHLANRGQPQSAPEIYETYCHHTLLHAATYLPNQTGPPPMKFAALASVCKGDPTHRRMCDYMAAQAVILQEPNGHSAQDWLCREYADMLRLARDRLLTEGEGAEDPRAPPEEDDPPPPLRRC